MLDSLRMQTACACEDAVLSLESADIDVPRTCRTFEIALESSLCRARAESSAHAQAVVLSTASGHVGPFSLLTALQNDPAKSLRNSTDWSAVERHFVTARPQALSL